MDEKLKNKIEQIQEMAKKSGKAGAVPQRPFLRSNDSLSQAIRNEKEAAEFIAELNAIVALARNE